MRKFLYWAIRIVPAIILLQTLFFKFTGDPQAVHIFSTLGVEPYGRIGLGVVELITATLLLIPKTAFYGAWLAVLIMVGAIFSHLTILGVEVQDDGGKLFILALVTLLFSGAYLLFRKKLVH